MWTKCCFSVRWLDVQQDDGHIVRELDVCAGRLQWFNAYLFLQMIFRYALVNITHYHRIFLVACKSNNVIFVLFVALNKLINAIYFYIAVAMCYMINFCFDLGLWKVAVVSGVCEPQESDDSQEQDKAATEDSQKETDETQHESNTQTKSADKAERQDNKGDKQVQQHQIQQQNDSNKENTDNANSQNENEEQVKEHEATSEVRSPPTCRLVMVLYGDQGKTQPLFLGDNESISSEIKFQPGIADEFIVS